MQSISPDPPVIQKPLNESSGAFSIDWQLNHYSHKLLALPLTDAPPESAQSHRE
jgi:hypothetical protein